ncbi:hypothetical protein IL54_4305 [Sphingobium sp. ba1]|nr:hypothetical protein IL54_4305 [Sphingobium sp. ba1]
MNLHIVFDLIMGRPAPWRARR